MGEVGPTQRDMSTRPSSCSSLRVAHHRPDTASTVIDSGVGSLYHLPVPLPPPVEISVAIAETAMTVVAFFLQIRDRQQRKPCYRRHTIPIVLQPEVNFDELKIIFQGEPIKDLSLTEFFFWNDGRKAFHEQDLNVGGGEHLRIEAKDSGRIFQTPRLVAEPKNGVSLSLPDKAASMTEVPIKFLFLNTGEGWVLTLKHTGEVELRGAFRDAKDLELKERPSGLAVLVSFLATWAFLFAGFFYLSGATFIVMLYSIYARTKNPAPAGFRKFLARNKLSLPFP